MSEVKPVKVLDSTVHKVQPVVDATDEVVDLVQRLRAKAKPKPSATPTVGNRYGYVTAKPSVTPTAKATIRREERPATRGSNSNVATRSADPGADIQGRQGSLMRKMEVRTREDVKSELVSLRTDSILRKGTGTEVADNVVQALQRTAAMAKAQAQVTDPPVAGHGKLRANWTRFPDQLDTGNDNPPGHGSQINWEPAIMAANRAADRERCEASEGLH